MWFCTPGFVMSLFSAYHDTSEHRATRSFINKTLAGNLCRCTGYAPIVRAARQSLEHAGTDQFDQNAIPVIEILDSLADGEMLRIRGDSGQFIAPTSTTELCQCLEDQPQATIVAGATDVGLWVTKHLQNHENLVYTGKVRELLEVKSDPQTKCLSIGAAVTYTQAMPEILEAYPDFEELLTRLGADQVRNAGTIGGNIANGSPIGDMPPALIALDAKLVLESSAGERILKLEDFFIDYGKQDLRDGEFVAKVLLPIPQSGQAFRTYKISKRTEQDISAVCAAFSLLNVEGKISDVRICFGGMAATPKRATRCEQALRGQQWNEESVSAAMQELTRDFSPISDMRASAGYRTGVARNLLKRFYYETSEKPVQTRLSGNDELIADVSV
jgi:xanthine dehydrogenase small subunit